MKNNTWEESLMEQTVTYTLLRDGQFFIIENVPTRVSVETGEQLFSPETVDKLQRLILDQRRPTRTIQTPVYEFAS